MIQANAGWSFACVFYDEGISGTSVDRPGFQALMTECERKNIDIILTKSISRFARNALDLLEIVRRLKKLGIEVRFEKENISTLSTDGELMLTLLASFAEEESHSVSENTRWAIRKKFEIGLECGAHVLYGYRKDMDGYHIKESEAEIVRSIFSDYLSGMSPHKIADRYGFSYSTVWQMLRQTKYMGDIMLQKTISIFDKTHKAHTRKRNEGEQDRFYVRDALPAIVPREVFQKVQYEIKSKLVNGKIFRRNPFTSVLICGECGRTYRRRNNDCGHYWKCSGKLEHTGCKAKNIKESLLYELCGGYLGILKLVNVFGDRLVIVTKEGEVEKRYDDTSEH